MNNNDDSHLYTIRNYDISFKRPVTELDLQIIAMAPGVNFAVSRGKYYVNFGVAWKYHKVVANIRIALDKWEACRLAMLADFECQWRER